MTDTYQHDLTDAQRAASLDPIPPCVRGADDARRAAALGARVAADALAALSFDSDPRALEAWFSTLPR